MNNFKLLRMLRIFYLTAKEISKLFFLLKNKLFVNRNID